MFEIGSTLRDARVRKDISLQQAEDETKIRVKYIQAMENEDFDVLPGGTYVKGFLRTYAEYLGLDFQLLLDEFNDRYSSGEHREHLIQPLQPVRTDSGPHESQGTRSQKNRSYILVAILAVAIIAVLAYLGWGNSSNNEATLVTTTGNEGGILSTVETVPPAEAAPRTVQTQTQTQPQNLQSIVFTATSSKNWVGVYRSNTISNSNLIWGGTLSPGESKTLSREEVESLDKVYLKTGSIVGLQVLVNDKQQELTGGIETIYVVTAAGISAQ